jgi:CRP-like cAMP-binding protein
MPNPNLSPQRGNWILDALPLEEYDRLRPHLKLVELHQNEILVNIQEPIKQIYFPTTALVSWLHSTEEGEMVEVGVTGFEGIVGTPLILDRDVAPWAVMVIITGQGYQLSTEVFVNALQKSPILRQKVTAFVYLKIVQLTQSALCNRFHAVEQRLCRWLLAAHDRVKDPELLLTRDILATMIGAHRPVVSTVTGTLQTAGLIRAIRGKIIILDREEMEEATCECYHVVKQEFDHYLQS